MLGNQMEVKMFKGECYVARNNEKLLKWSNIGLKGLKMINLE